MTTKLRIGELWFTKRLQESKAFGVRYDCDFLHKLAHLKLLYFPDDSSAKPWQASIYVHPTKDIEECELQVDSEDHNSADEAVAEVLMRFKSCQKIIGEIKI